MAKVKELKEIFKYIPIHQAVLLIGDHGKGKSQFAAQLAKEDDAICITIFLGQTADAGDIIGLPTRIEVIDGDNKYYITSFAQMEWWPRDPDKKYYIFFDEINRAKPELMNCIMDLVLNRKMNGRNLPKNTRIIAAMNPLKDGYYQVEALDPALLDRFNVYNFDPDVDDWIDWAMTKEIHPAVISFIAKHGSQHLDPPSSTDAVSDQVHPSRRSWERVSEILVEFGDNLLEGDMHTLANIVFGIVGQGTTSQFIQHIKTAGIGLDARMILTKMDEKIQKKVKDQTMQIQCQLVDQIVYWLDMNSSEMNDNQTFAMGILKNLETFISCCHAEASARFFGKLNVDFREKQKEWTNIVAAGSPKLGKLFTQIMKG